MTPAIPYSASEVSLVIYIYIILNAISPDLDLAYYRLRYYGHIINLVAKAFLFSDNPVAFKLKIENTEKLNLKIRHKQELLTL